MLEQNERIDKNIANMFEAIRLITANGGGSSQIVEKPTGDPPPAQTNLPILQPPVADSQRGGRSNTIPGYSGVTRLSKIDFPRFSGDKIKDWLFKIEQFFSIDHTPENLKVGLASIHFDGPAATWHQSLMQSELGVTVASDWPAYTALLKERFDELLDDPIAELKLLQETDGIVDYHNKFELIRMRVQLPESYLVSAYLAGLSTLR